MQWLISTEVEPYQKSQLTCHFKRNKKRLSSH